MATKNEQIVDRAILDLEYAISVRKAEVQLQCGQRHVRGLIRKGLLQAVGMGQHRRITTESIALYVGHKRKPELNGTDRK